MAHLVALPSTLTPKEAAGVAWSYRGTSQEVVDHWWTNVMCMITAKDKLQEVPFPPHWEEVKITLDRPLEDIKANYQEGLYQGEVKEYLTPLLLMVAETKSVSNQVYYTREASQIVTEYTSLWMEHSLGDHLVLARLCPVGRAFLETLSLFVVMIDQGNTDPITRLRLTEWAAQARADREAEE